jgi:hypothetical protein
VISSLRCRCHADEKYQTNQVNSVYFDTLNWACADEKAASDYLKTKVRVRWYSEVTPISAQPVADQAVNAGSVFLEIKRKTGSTRDKVRKQLPLGASQFIDRVQSAETAELIRSELNDVAPELGNLDLFPRILVQYQRRRFVDPLTGSRIAYDSNIRGRAITRAPAERFSVLLPQSVLEVKGSEQDLPVNLRFLNAMHLKKAAFSKYYECYRELTRYDQ